MSPLRPIEIRLLLAGAIEDLLARDHHAHVDDLVVVAGEHHAHDVLADVVDVALHRGEDDLALRPLHLSGGGHGSLLGLHERRQVGDRLLHHARGFDDLGEEHLARPEEVADDAHAVHQRPLDHGERAAELGPRLLGVGVDEGVDALDQRVGQPLLDRSLAPLLFSLLGGGGAGALGLEPLAEVDQALGGVGAAVQQDVLDQGAQLGLDLLVDLEHAGVDDAHVHAGLDGVVEEGRVHRLADAGSLPRKLNETLETPPLTLAPRQVGLDPAGGLDEVDRVVVVLLDAGADGEHVGIEDDVLGGEARARPPGCR